MKKSQVNSKATKLLILAIGILSFSCVSDSLKEIELTTQVFSEFRTNSSPNMEQDTVVFGNGNLVTLFDDLGVSSVDLANIKSITPQTVILRLNTPADSTFALFDSLWVYLKNENDSIRIAEFGQETRKNVKEITIRRFSVNAREFLVNPNSLQIGLGYSLDSNSVDTLNISFGALFLVEGELD